MTPSYREYKASGHECITSDREYKSSEHKCETIKYKWKASAYEHHLRPVYIMYTKTRPVDALQAILKQKYKGN